MRTRLIDIPAKDYEKLIDTFFQSEDMKLFLKRQILSDNQLIQIIAGAPVPLVTKRDWIDRLSTYEKMHATADTYKVDYAVVLADIQAALLSLTLKDSKTVFTLEECWYDYDILEEKNSLHGPFYSFEAVVEHIQSSEAEENAYIEAGEELPMWWTVRQWFINSDESPERIYSFYMIHDEVCWFIDEKREYFFSTKEELRNYRLGHSWGYYNPFFRSEYLGLPVPYVPGDIVEINTYPFGPSQSAIIFDFADDDKIISILTRDYKGNWYIGSLLNNSFGRSVYQQDIISPLFRIKKWNKKIESDEKVYLLISEYLKGDRNKGRVLWEALFETKKEWFTDEDIVEIVRKLDC